MKAIITIFLQCLFMEFTCPLLPSLFSPIDAEVGISYGEGEADGIFIYEARWVTQFVDLRVHGVFWKYFN